MDTKSRIASILKAENLDSSVTGFPSFRLAQLKLQGEFDFELPNNLRLGHLVEKVVSGLIKRSRNFEMLYENIQIVEDKNTLGELDFIIEEDSTKRIIHLELAYKFYLYDPRISEVPIMNWIGPNRKDSLQEKLEKLKRKQFPLLDHPQVKAKLRSRANEQISQALCFLVSLFIPFDFKDRLDPVFENTVKGYYLNFERFKELDRPSKSYCLPDKRQWGMAPSENNLWMNAKELNHLIADGMEEKRAVLCWQKEKDLFSSFFIVWW